MKFIIDHLVNVVFTQLIIHPNMNLYCLIVQVMLLVVLLHSGSTGTADHPNAIVVQNLQHFVVE
jgi:hypothetical protein